MGAAGDILFMILGVVLLALCASGTIQMGVWGYLGSIACIGFGAQTLLRLRRQHDALKSELLQDPRVVTFYQNTLNAWASGQLAGLGKSFEREGRGSFDHLVSTYRPVEGSALQAMFQQYPPMPNEYLVGVGNSPSSNKGWFVLTSERVILRDNGGELFREIYLRDIASFDMQGTWTKTIHFTMKSGGVTTIEKLEMFPRKNYLEFMLAQKQGAPQSA